MEAVNVIMLFPNHIKYVELFNKTFVNVKSIVQL